MMRKLKWIAISCIFFMCFMGTALADNYGVTNYGTEGLTNTDIATNITQITMNPNSNSDMVQCWGTNPWSPDSSWIIYQMNTEDDRCYSEIAKIKPDGTGFVQLTSNSVCDNGGSFTPDGSKIVFARENADTGSQELWIMNSDGSNQSVLYAKANYCCHKPLVSPDGTKVLFHGSDNCGDDIGLEETIWVVDINGSNAKVLSGTWEKCSKMSWSPDSQWVIFNHQTEYASGDYSRIYKVAASGLTPPVMLSPNTILGADDGGEYFCENWATWSPDGEWIAFHQYFEPDNSTNYDELSSIYIMKPDGTGRQLVAQVQSTSDNGYRWVCAPTSWGPDSKKLVFKKYYYTGSQSEYHLYVADIESGNTLQITKDYSDGRMWWSPDGTKILMREYYNPSRDGYTLDRDLLVITLDAAFCPPPPPADDDNDEGIYEGHDFSSNTDGSSNDCFISTIMD